MLDPKLIRQSLDTVALQLKKRGLVLEVEKIKRLEEERKRLQVKMQECQNERNVHSKAVGHAKASGKNVDEALINLKTLSDALTLLEAQFTAVQAELDGILMMLPNLPHDSVPEGKSETDNQVLRVWGEAKTFSFTPKDHVALAAGAAMMPLMDFETATKLSGARFVVLRGALAHLQRALIQFMLDLHTREHGYEEITVPYLVNEASLLGTGQFPKLKEDVFAIAGDNPLYLIPTAEVPVTNTIRDCILEANQLPLKYVCYSSCFRSEAGSYGKDLRGMLRHHQFEKVELVQIVPAATSYEVHEHLTQHAEVVLQRLGLAYRVISLCAGDLGFSAAKTYDLEVWLPGQNRYREISSCSNTEAFQARRMKARWRDPATQKVELLHTLNGSALAVGRTMVAIIENYQDELGRVHIPEVLQPYMNGLSVIEF